MYKDTAISPVLGHEKFKQDLLHGSLTHLDLDGIY